MEAEELKSLVEAGNYKPDPSQIAVAMLRRRGVRELLTGVTPVVRGDRTPQPRAASPRAA